MFDNTNKIVLVIVLIYYLSFWYFQLFVLLVLQNLSHPKQNTKLDPVGSTVRYEMMELCTGSVRDTTRGWQVVIDDTGSVEGICAFIY